MNKPYSNKALPAGTVLREWRLEEVLGVGGFGIVYKGRGIYFDELVAIKEYFPSSISEREPDDTVVPIDSDAEEVHALGLKKFVEEAKLLWNLSTPSRHPNIVSVRSLFEIHGTAYMVMDFEDGIALSKLLKEGTRFNERTLWNIVRPIAEGLDRAHRVGVLHRDIKPPNILITQDSRPVLIDFGSARFEAAEATSTKVTFHTPPYAALEQYVKTFPQGPWTDIYALGVVLYECVTGKKPAEVLERMHGGGVGDKLSDGKWPGYSKKFLAAVDAAMAIRPEERPQSIADWLGLFGKPAEADQTDASDDDATRVFTHELATPEIVPVAPAADGFPKRASIETQVPDDPSEVQFKAAGQETGARKKVAAAAAAAAAADVPGRKAKQRGDAAAEPPAKVEPESAAKGSSPTQVPAKQLSPMMIGGAAVALVVAAGGAWAIFGGGGRPVDAVPAATNGTNGVTASNADLETLAAAMRALASDAGKAGAPMSAVTALSTAGDQLAEQYRAYRALSDNPAQKTAAEQRAGDIRQLATRANADFAAALLRDGQSKARQLSAAAPWANPLNEAAARNESGERQMIAGNVRTALAQLNSAAVAASKATSPAQAHDYARMALMQLQSLTAASMTAYNNRDTKLAADIPAPRAEKAAATPAAPAKATSTAPAKSAAAPAAAASATTLSPAKIRELNSIVDDARGMAKRVMRMRGSGPGGETIRANAALAKSYDQNLATLKDAGRGAKSDRDADRMIAQAKQTRAYVQFLLNQSSNAR